MKKAVTKQKQIHQNNKKKLDVFIFPLNQLPKNIVKSIAFCSGIFFREVEVRTNVTVYTNKNRIGMSNRSIRKHENNFI